MSSSEPSQHSAAATLCRKPLILVTGKGGVGKSTCAQALACAAHSRGASVLICEMGSEPSVPHVLGGEPSFVPYQPDVQQWPRLWACWLQFLPALKEYLGEQLKVKRLVRLATENRVLARLWEAAPSVAEMAILNTIYGHVHSGRFDVVVLDLPSTGHALTLLQVPGAVASMVRVGALAQRAKDVQATIASAAATSMVVVTLAEALPVSETIDLSHKLTRLGLPPNLVLANELESELFDPAEGGQIEALVGELPDGPGRALLEAGRRRARLQRQQQQQLQTLSQAVDVPIFTLPRVTGTPATVVGILSQELESRAL